jgi:hypothetical protein
MLLLNVVTSRIEAIFLSGNKLCMPVSKMSAHCGISHVMTPSITYSLLLKSCDLNHFVQVGIILQFTQYDFGRKPSIIQDGFQHQ